MRYLLPYIQLIIQSKGKNLFTSEEISVACNLDKSTINEHIRESLIPTSVLRIKVPSKGNFPSYYELTTYGKYLLSSKEILLT